VGKQAIKQNPLVSIVIINYNTAEVTIESLKSIIENTSYSPYEVIIIDNASEQADQSILNDFAQSESIPIHIMDENTGWNRGVNYGFSIAKGYLLLTINSDVIVETGWLSSMVDLYLSADQVGAVNANIYEDGKSIVSAKDNHLKILHGACSMFSSEAWDMVGELDYKNFGFYGTENDWSYRARSLGYKLLLSKHSRVNHLGSSIINAGGGLSVQKTGKTVEFLKMRLDGRIKFRVYNFKIRDWFSKQILFEFKDAFNNGYLAILIFSYLRVLANMKNVYQARKQRHLNTKRGIKILESGIIN
jgi:GT2 family glycosyltransferase